MLQKAADKSARIVACFIKWRSKDTAAKRTRSRRFGTFEGVRISGPEDTMKRIIGLLGLLGTLAIMQPDGTVKRYATFPMGGTQMSVLELDTGKTWMIRKSDVHGSTGDIIDYDNGDIYHWNTTDGCRRCGDRQRQEE
jgi:hypothetical protein